MYSPPSWSRRWPAKPQSCGKWLINHVCEQIWRTLTSEINHDDWQTELCAALWTVNPHRSYVSQTVLYYCTITCLNFVAFLDNTRETRLIINQAPAVLPPCGSHTTSKDHPTSLLPHCALTARPDWKSRSDRLPHLTTNCQEQLGSELTLPCRWYWIT